MSITAISKIRLDEKAKEVYIMSKYDSTALFPQQEEEWKHLSDLWKKEGFKAVEDFLTFYYYTGQISGGQNKYNSRGRALRKKFPWGSQDREIVGDYIKQRY